MRAKAIVLWHAVLDTAALHNQLELQLTQGNAQEPLHVPALSHTASSGNMEYNGKAMNKA